MMKTRVLVFLVIVFISVALIFVKDSLIKWSPGLFRTGDLVHTTSKVEREVGLEVKIVSPHKHGPGIFPKMEPHKTIDILKRELSQKFLLPAVNVREFPDFCNWTTSRGNSCDGQCQRLAIDKDVRKRIAQLIEPSHLRLTSYYHQVLKKMAQQVKGQYEVIIATAASDNHYLENQGLIKNLHENIFPLLSNFTFIYYNLGLSTKNRAELVKYCKCQVVDFPFSKFPSNFKNLFCYTWKPVIIKAHIKQSNVLIWADSSIRFKHNSQAFYQMLNETIQRGLLFKAKLHCDVAVRTMPTTFHFFGEEPCAYIGRGELQATFGFFSRSFLVERLFLEPWVACAVDQKCMCPDSLPPRDVSFFRKSDKMMDMWKMGKGVIKYGMTHLYDQSAMNLILMKIYRERYMDLILQEYTVSVARGHTVYYFPSNESFPN